MKKDQLSSRLATSGTLVLGRCGPEPNSSDLVWPGPTTVVFKGDIRGTGNLSLRFMRIMRMPVREHRRDQHLSLRAQGPFTSRRGGQGRPTGV